MTMTNPDVPGSLTLPPPIPNSDDVKNVAVKLGEKEVKTHNSTLYVGNTWSTKDKDGKALTLADMKVTGSVDTSKAGTYTIHYTYDGLDKKVTVTVKAKVNNTVPGMKYQAAYRLYNKNTGEHFYTESAFERVGLPQVKE